MLYSLIMSLILYIYLKIFTLTAYLEKTTKNEMGKNICNSITKSAVCLVFNK